MSYTDAVGCDTACEALGLCLKEHQSQGLQEHSMTKSSKITDHRSR